MEPIDVEINLDLADLLDMTDPEAVLDGILAMVGQHRDAAVNEYGFSAESAEQMGVALHSIIATRLLLGPVQVQA